MLQSYRLALPRFIVALIVLLSVTACIGNTPVHYYSPSVFALNDGADSVSDTAPSSLQSSFYTVSRVTVPAAVSRPGMVFVQENGAIQVSSQHLWVEPLKDSIQLSITLALNELAQEKLASQELVARKIEVDFETIYLYTSAHSVLIKGAYTSLSKAGLRGQGTPFFIKVAADEINSSKDSLSEQGVLTLVETLQKALRVLAKDIIDNAP